MAAAHEVTELAFDLGSGGPVVGAPGGVGLPGPGSGERGLVDADPDRAPARGGGALGAQLAGGARVSEAGEPASVTASADGDGDPGGAGHRVGVEIGLEAVFGEQTTRRRRRG